MFTPATVQDFAARNMMLQKSLREPGLRFPIEAEYPIVLSEDGRQFSFCFREGDLLVAHANLWPRIATCSITKQQWNVGLIGNVATDERFRGRGIMSAVLKQLQEVATLNDMVMLFLWSDLLEFYQKQGFRSFGEEIRYFFYEQSLQRAARSDRNFVKFDNNEVFPETLREFIALRPHLKRTLTRRAEEFKAMLSIPCTEIYCATTPEGRITSYAILGKGADMDSVVHEWGGAGDELLALLYFIMKRSDRELLMLLTPGALDRTLHERFAQDSIATERHPMALAWTNKRLADMAEPLSDLFIWGLDSI
jgi:GNAT superfamily N-acetyltransferase